MLLVGLTLSNLSKHSDCTTNQEFGDQLHYVILKNQGAFLPFLMPIVPEGVSQYQSASHFELACESYLVSSNFISRVIPD